MAPILKEGTYFIINKKATNSAFDLSVQDMKSIIGYNRNRGSNQMVRPTPTLLHHDR